MARVTVEDCVERVPNRFDLVLLAAQRAREIAAGSLLTIERDNDKNPVVALREIADETVGLEQVHEGLVRRFQRQAEKDEPEEDRPDFDPVSAELTIAMQQMAQPRVSPAADDDGDGDVSLDSIAEREFSHGKDNEE